MYRYKVTGSLALDHPSGRDIIIVYVTARTREDALNKAFDDMGLMAVCSVRRIGVKLRS